MIDKELLKLAAMGARLVLWKTQDDGEPGLLVHGGDGPIKWNPLEDDGAALRLAVNLNMHICRFDSMTTARIMGANWGCDERDDGAPVAATRRAIVRVAAEIGSLHNAGAEPREASASGNLLYDTRKNT